MTGTTVSQKERFHWPVLSPTLLDARRVVAGVCLCLGLVAVFLGAGAWLMVAAMLVASVVGFNVVDNRMTVAHGESIGAWLWRRWNLQMDRKRGTAFWRRQRLAFDHRGQRQIDPSPLFKGVEVWAYDPDADGHRMVGVRHAGRLTLMASAKPSATSFGLADAAEKERQTGALAAALAAAGADPDVAELGWSQNLRPGSLESHRAYLRNRAYASDPRMGIDAGDWYGYSEALEELGGAAVVAVDTTVFVTVEVKGNRLAAAETARQAMRRVKENLAAAGIEVGRPFSNVALARHLQERLDPNATLVAPNGIGSSHDPFQVAGVTPSAIDERWGHIRVDGAAHVSLEITEWPRVDVDAGWLAPLMEARSASAQARTVTVTYRPVSRAQSQSDINQEMRALQGDQEDQAKFFGRAGIDSRLAMRSVEQREAELGDGHVEMDVSAVITVTSETADAAERAVVDVVNAGFGVGIKVGRLWGGQAAGFATSLAMGMRN